MTAVQIPLVSGGFAIADADDAAKLLDHKWYMARRGRMTYATRIAPHNSIIYMHREIVGAVKGDIVDHINWDGLDNRRGNLRFTDKQGNSANRGLQANNTSGFRGVVYRPKEQAWTAEIKVNGKRRYLGFYHCPNLAAAAYNAAAREAFGEFAFQNQIPVGEAA